MISVACFGVRVSVDVLPYVWSYTFSSVWVTELPPFRKQLPARLAIYSQCLLSICNIYLFPVLVLRAGFSFDCSSSCALLYYYFYVDANVNIMYATYKLHPS